MDDNGDDDTDDGVHSNVPLGLGKPINGEREANDRLCIAHFADGSIMKLIRASFVRPPKAPLSRRMGGLNSHSGSSVIEILGT